MIWFTDNGVIIGVNNGYNIIDFRILEKSEVKYFKSIISYKNNECKRNSHYLFHY